MAFVKAVVYDPPSPDFPYLAVIFETDGQVLAARTVLTRAHGETLLDKLKADFQAKIDADKAAKSKDDDAARPRLRFPRGRR